MTKKGIKNRIIVAFVALFAGCFSIAGIARVFATAESGMLSFETSGDVVLDGTSGAQVTVSLTAAQVGKLYVAQGGFATTEADDSDHHFAINSLTYSSVISGYSLDHSSVSGQYYYKYSQAGDGVNFAVGDHLYEMVYDVAADTPAGTYHLPISVEYVQTEDLDIYEEEVVVSATVTVTRNDAPAEKPTQVVTFRDGEGEAFTEITKHYGDEPFVVDVVPTEGTVVPGSYHPMDSAEGPHVVTTDPGSNLVNVENVGNVQVCATVAETENYAETTACYTVYVEKRTISISGATISDKTYNGLTDAEVTAVEFSNLGNGTPPTYTAKGEFGTAGAGVDKAIRVDVTLPDDALERYTLSPSYYNTTKTIEPFGLIRENVELVNGDTYTYNPDGVEPEVRVTVDLYGGKPTLVENQDYEVSYNDNMGVGTGHVTVTGMGNFSTNVPIVLDYTINKKGISNEDVIVLGSIVEGRILAPEDVSVNVDGYTLTRCATDGEMNCDYVLTISGDNDGEVGHTVHVAVNGRNNYDGAGVADVNIVAKQEQTVTIEDVTDTIVNKSYGDANFTYVAISTGNSDISYRSTAEAVATVDMNTGEVSIVGVGDADIIATAAENDTYAEGSAKYTVHVDKKVITVTNATVADKTFDNTPVATVSDVTLSEGSLVYNTDFTATGLFNDVTPAIRNVNVMVALTNEAYKNYCFMYESSCIQNTSYAAIGTIMPFTLGGDNAVEELTEDTFVYNSSEQCPAANVRVDLNGNGIKDVVLSAGTDYDVVCDNNVNVGTSATATITGKGNYTGSLEGLTFSITPATVEDVAVTAASQDYTGEPLEPVLTVTGTVNGESKTFTTDDYEVAPHGNFITAGDYTVTINPKDGSNYSIPSTSGTFTINKAASGTPAESSQNLKIEAGKTLSELGDLSEGFAWADGSTVVSEGSHDYDATYTKNGDTENYVTENVSVIVYGLKRIEITTAIFAGGEVMTPGGTALEGDEISWTITPDEGYELWRFSVNEEEKTGEVSGGRFTMIAGTEDIMAIVYFRRLYQFIDGMEQTHVRGVDGAAEFEIDADYELFEDGGRVFVDGELLDEGNYRVWSGSTMIELSADYLNSLTIGEHTLAVEFDDGGIARTTFVIADPEAPEEEKPAAADTGVFTGMRNGAIATGLSMVTMGAVAGLLYGIKKRNNRA